MAKLPLPPAPESLRRVPPKLLTLGTERPLWRIYFRGGPHPTLWNAFRHWGPGNGRFDHHLSSADGGGTMRSRGILYAADRIGTCVAEVFQDTRSIDRTARVPWLVAFAPARPLTLLDLTGRWTTRIGASMALSSGPRPRARVWARALYDAFPQAEGIAYRSAMYGGAPAFALFERAAGVLPSRPHLQLPLDDPRLEPGLERIAEEIGYSLL